MSHYSYSEIAQKYLERNWGRRGDLDEILKSIGSEQVLLGTVQLLVSKVDGILDGLLSGRIKERIERCEKEMDQAFRRQINWREEEHGPCPSFDLMVALEKSTMASRYHILRRELVGDTRYLAVELVLPPKGTEMRKVYDRWMKRKPKKGKKGA